MLVRIRPKPRGEWIGLDSGSLLTEAAAVRSVFVLVLRPVLFWPVLVIVLDKTKYAKRHNTFKPPEALPFISCPALAFFQKTITSTSTAALSTSTTKL